MAALSTQSYAASVKAFRYYMPCSPFWNRRWFSSVTGTKSVGFIGLGNMGLPMASRLASHGIPVWGFDTNFTCRELAASQHGIQVVESIAAIIDASQPCDRIFTMLPHCAAVDNVMGELQQAMGSNQRCIIVDCSTVHPQTSRRWHESWLKMGCEMLDAPVSGGVKGARDGTLTFMVGTGADHTMHQVKPLLDIMGKNTIPCGGPGNGAVAKLCNNLALATQMAGICEAMNLGEALGMDPVVLASVMNKSTAKCWSCEVNNPHPLVAAAVAPLVGSAPTSTPPAARNYEGGFHAKLMLKDLVLASQAAEDTQTAVPVTSITKELYKMANLKGFGQKDFGILLQLLRRS